MQNNRGIVGDVFGHGPGSGLASVEINRPDGSSFLVNGDWRMIAAIGDDLAGQEVVVEDDGNGERVIPVVVESDVVVV